MKQKTREKILAKLIVDEWLHNHPSTKLDSDYIENVTFRPYEGFMTITITWKDTKGKSHSYVWNRWNNEL